MILGDSKTNKWCAFCSNWYDPKNSALKPRNSRDMYDVDDKKTCKCKETGLSTKALFKCSKFKSKF